MTDINLSEGQLRVITFINYLELSQQFGNVSWRATIEALKQIYDDMWGIDEIQRDKIVSFFRDCQSTGYDTFEGM